MLNGHSQSIKELLNGEPVTLETLGLAQKAEGGLALEVARLLARRLTLWTDEEGEAWADLDDGRALPLASRGFKAWARGRIVETLGRAPSSQVWEEALRLLEAWGLESKASFPVAVRVAGHGGALYLDLGGDPWKVVRITRDGWRLFPMQEAPLRFRRPSSQKGLPEPERGGSVEELRPFLNLPEGEEGEDAWTLLLAFLLGSLRPRGPYPILALTGERGSGKTTTARVLKRLVDPQTAEVKAPPRSTEDLAVAAHAGWLLLYDNLGSGGLPPWLSDAFCRLSTGDGLTKRKLYTDYEEAALEYARPVILTSIVDPAKAPDLLERLVPLSLPPILEGEREPEEEFWARFEAARPRVLGALLDLATHALGSTARPKALPRLADFALWAYRALEPLGLSERFLEAMRRAREEAEATALEGDPVAEGVKLLLQERGGFTGTTRELYKALEEVLGLSEAKVKPARWPRSEDGLGRALRVLAPALRAAGVKLNRTHTRQGNVWEIYPAQVSQVPQVSQAAPERQKPRDTWRDTSTGEAPPRVSQAGASVTQVSHEKTDNEGPGDTMTPVKLLPDVSSKGGGNTPTSRPGALAPLKAKDEGEEEEWTWL